jgi:hypothetical protein
MGYGKGLLDIFFNITNETSVNILHKTIVNIFHIQYNNNNKALHIYIANSFHPLMVMVPVFSLDQYIMRNYGNLISLEIIYYYQRDKRSFIIIIS